MYIGNVTGNAVMGKMLESINDTTCVTSVYSMGHQKSLKDIVSYLQAILSVYRRQEISKLCRGTSFERVQLIRNTMRTVMCNMYQIFFSYCNCSKYVLKILITIL